MKAVPATTPQPTSRWRKAQNDTIPRWLSALLAANDVEQVAQLIVEQAELQMHGVNAKLLWSLDAGSDWSYRANRSVSATDLALADEAAAMADGCAVSSTGSDTVFAWGVVHAGARVVLLCNPNLAGFQGISQYEAFVALLHPYLTNVLEKIRLSVLLERRERSEKLQRALFAISDMAGSDLEMPEMLLGLHKIVGSLMYAENFFIALYEAEADTIRFLYFADVADADKPNNQERFPLAHFEQGLTWYLIRDGRPLRGSNDEIARQVSGPLRTHGTQSFDWLGVPMIRGNTVHGALVVQSYKERPRYTEHDQALLSFVGSHILTALDRKQAHEELERRVELRTHELAKANAKLIVDAEERQRAERLQRVLYRIAELSQTTISMEDFYAAIHFAVGELINATNFYIALLSTDGKTLHFPYFVDVLGAEIAVRPIGAGSTEYVLRTSKALLASAAEIDRLHDEGKIQLVGPKAQSWLGVPLICGNSVVGVIAVQSYSTDVRYTAEDLELLTFVSYQVANSLERKRAREALKAANAELEERVAERTSELREQIAVRQRIEIALQQRNADLEALNARLVGTQGQLLQSEKMASVGQLAAGVAHEINNPIGYVRSNLNNLDRYLQGVFAVLDEYEKLERALPRDLPALAAVRARKELVDLAFLRQDLVNLMSESVEGVTRVVKIVNDLKDFSHIDQGEWQLADLHLGLETTLNVARHELKYKAEIVREYGELPLIECLPSQLNQVFLNILVNAAQAIEKHGVITIRTRYETDTAVIEISDTGKGIAPIHINRIFEPFFTTKPVGVGTGLGLSVSYGIVQKHGGTIEARSELGVGTTFTIRLPKVHPIH